MIEKANKDPSDTLDFGFDWEEWLNGDTISASTWTVPTGITQVTSSNTTTTATVWLSGGTVGHSYLVTNHITTAASRQKDRSFVVMVTGE